VPAVDPSALPTQTFEWGSIKWLVSPATEPEARVTFGEVVLLPGKGHERHNHPGSEEILYVLAGHRVLGLDAALDELAAGDDAPKVVLTFDDGFADVHDVAYRCWPSAGCRSR
jgi:quercetin dioxygenase-like cupin family protein